MERTAEDRKIRPKAKLAGSTQVRRTELALLSMVSMKAKKDLTCNLLQSGYNSIESLFSILLNQCF